MADWTKHKVPNPGYDNINDKANKFPATIGLLINSGFGNYKGLSLYILANFLKAAKEPVNVTPPINTPKNDAIECKASGWPHEI